MKQTTPVSRTQLLRVLRTLAEPPLTQRQLATKAQMNATRYWLIEHGEGPSPRPAEQAAIAAALGVTVAEIDWP